MPLFAAKLVYSADVLLKLHGARPQVLKRKEQKLETFYDKASMITYHCIKEGRENNFKSISNEKKLKIACFTFQYLLETIILAF